MKKIFTLICALTAVFATAQAQDVVFTYGGEVLEEGAEVTAQAVDWTEFGMGFMVDSNTPKVLEVKNTGASSTRVSVNVKVVEGDYAKIQWCGITTQCQKMASTTETRSTTLAAGASTRLNLDTEFHEGEYGVRSVLVTATANGESVSMTFHMENKEAGATVVSSKTYTDNLIVTINEEIKEGGGTTIVKEYDWVETGLNITPPDYEPRIIELEEQVKENTTDIANLKKGVGSTTPIKTWDKPIYDANIPVFSLSAEKAAIPDTEKTVAGVYARYDALMARHPQYITRTKDTVQCGGQRMGTGHKIMTHQRIFRAECLRIYHIQNISATVIVTVTGGTGKMGLADMIICKCF